jgi:protein-S-isoprenylcysteine O-methyltransferase Ste14
MARHGIDIPPVYFLVALGVMALLDFVMPLLPLIVRPYRLAGAVFVVLGFALAGWAALLFRRARTGIVPFSPATALVARGPYRLTRNPMYLGMAVVLLGAAILFGSLTPFLVIPAFMAVIADRFIAREEAMLESAFGAPYLEYKAKVRRWL